MILSTDISDRFNELTKIRFALVRQKNITDWRKYVMDWDALAKAYNEINCPNNAAVCKSNADRYAKENSVEIMNQPVEQKEVIVTIDGETTIKFKNEDQMAGWLADVMNPGVA